jgi:SAM-dependent methyltransferase
MATSSPIDSPTGALGLRKRLTNAMRNPFSRTQAGDAPSLRPTVLTGPRIPRHSSGWSALLAYLKSEPGLRILDIGPTSPTNINFLTALGHGVYMADIVSEAVRDDLMIPGENGSDPQFDVERFLDQNLDFAGREFDVVLLWTTLDYIPGPLVAPVIQRFRSSMRPGGRILALFHTRSTGAHTAFCRYHITDGETIEMQETNPLPVQRVYTNRTIEKIFEAYANMKFFLAKDNLYEVIITR